MFNVGTGELVLILTLALIVLGPDKLPDAARQVGRYLAEFRRVSTGFQQEFRNAVDAAMVDPPTKRTTTSSFSLPDPALLGTELPEVPEVSLGKPDRLDDREPPEPPEPPERLHGEPGSPPGEPGAHADIRVDGPSSSFN